MWLTHFSSAQKFYLILGLFSMGIPVRLIWPGHWDTETGVFSEAFLNNLYWRLHLCDIIEPTWFQFSKLNHFLFSLPIYKMSTQPTTIRLLQLNVKISNLKERAWNSTIYWKNTWIIIDSLSILHKKIRYCEHSIF